MPDHDLVLRMLLALWLLAQDRPECISFTGGILRIDGKPVRAT
jgi:hypothetical protein